MLERARPTRDSGIKKQARGKASVSNSGQTVANMRGCGPGARLTAVDG